MWDNPSIQELTTNFNNDKSAKVRNAFCQIQSEEKKTGYEEAKDTSTKYVTEEEANNIDISTIMKEIEQEGTEKIAQRPIGMKIDEIDS